MPAHTVLIATCDRVHLLGRALASVAAQRHKPDRIIVIDDSPSPDINAIRRLGGEHGLDLDVLENRRTKGASGSWNTGLDHLARQVRDPNDHIVSILDDDDWWDPDYLHFVSLASGAGVEVIAGSIRRYDERTPVGRLARPPATLAATDFLAGNPGIQGSNLSVRLSTLLEAGLFDEALPSCTDRDLCIRLADLGVSYRTAPRAVAHHDCIHGGKRLSDPGGAKWQGLEAFHAKWRMRMTHEQYEASIARASRLFDWTPVDEAITSDPVALPISLACPHEAEPLQLVVGIIVDGNKPRRCIPLIDGMAMLSAHPLVNSVDVVLLENGDHAGFVEVTEHARALGISPWLVGMAEQLLAVPALPLEEGDIDCRKSIAVARTLLQRFVFEVSKARNYAPAWIVDDDFRLPANLDELVTAMIVCRNSGIEVALGGNSGAAPVPASSLLRTQLVDLVHLLTWSSEHLPDELFPDAERENRRWLHGRSDVHYDLSRSQSDRLETPLVPALPHGTLADAVFDMMRRAERIFAGEPITRPVTEMAVCPPEAAPSSCWRGGNTFITDTTLLRDIPNMAPRVDGRPTRRSDMIWAVNARDRFGKVVKAFRLPMFHDRATERADADDTQRLVDDILGYGFFSAYEEVMRSRGGPSQLSDEERAGVFRLTRKYATERLAAYRLSFWRAQGLYRALERLMASEPWWIRDADHETRIAFDHFRALLAQTVKLEHLERVEEGVEAGLVRGRFNDFLSDMDRIHPEHQVSDSVFFDDWACREREARACALIAGRLGRQEMQLLGMGAEGVVLRTGERVVKVFDRWTPAQRRKAAPVLAELMAEPTRVALPVLLAIHDWPDVFVVEYDFEVSRPYDGGRGSELVAMLRDLRQCGWVHTNVSPKNLRAVGRGLQLIDVGKSLERATPRGEEMMIRRAFLSWRFAERDDLVALMRASLETEFLPELTGWRTLMGAVVEESSKTRLDQTVHKHITSLPSRTVLDYGCGKPRNISEWETGRQVTVFDIDPSLPERWRREAPQVRFWGEDALASALTDSEAFDIVLCALVLCAVDDPTMASVLRNLRRLVKDDGRVIVAVCDPTAIHVGETVDQTRQGTACHDPALPARYLKRVNGASVLREEHHRSLDSYRRAFAKAGFRVGEEFPVAGFDAQRLERVPEFLVFELAPLPELAARTSLLIKLCAMEAETAYHQVRHLERQLARPRAFDEVVLLIDPHEGPFPRAHSPANLSGLRIAAGRLQAEGIVDRIVEGFADGSSASLAARHWTGCDVPRAHCANGQPAAAILAAMENCTGSYILHVDADVLIARPEPALDHIAAAVKLLEEYPEAITLALSVHGDVNPLPRRETADGVPCRVEAMCGWMVRHRLEALRPLEGGADAGRLNLPWHRMVDRAVRQGKAASLRCGSHALWFTALDNLRKGRREIMDLIMGRMEAGHAPALQAGRPLVVGALADWLEPKRYEAMVVIVCGRNVRPGSVERCFASLRAQSNQDWGAIVIDDASDEPCREAVGRECLTLGDRVTLLRRHQRMGLLANTTLAVRELVQSPNAVIVLVDMDDALADPEALALAAATHDGGADLTVGSMLRTDKTACNPADFSDPRRKRGGNVWQHLRTFRKSLFDRIHLADLKLDGEWIDLANDWAYMLPMAEMAENPIWLRQKLYLHEPSTSRAADEKAAREAVISRIVAKPTYRGRAMSRPQVTVLCYHRILEQLPASGPDALFYRRGMAVTAATMRAQLDHALREFEPVRIADLMAAQRGERSLPDRALLVSVDDGYRDFAIHGLPLLLKAGIEPLLFARQPAMDGLPSWSPLDLLYVGRGLAGEEMPFPNPDWRMRLLERPLEQQIAEVERTIGMGCAQLEPERRALYLSGAELRSLPGVALGCHGIDHVRWTNLDDSSLHKTLSSCRFWLESLGMKHLVAAYPDGAVDGRVASCLKSIGFEVAFALSPTVDPVDAAFARTRIIMNDDPDQLVRLAIDEREDVA